MAEIIEFPAKAENKPERTLGHTIHLYYGPDGFSAAHVLEKVHDCNALAEDLEKLARSLRSQAEDDIVVATIQIFRSSHVVAYMSPALVDEDNRAWLARRLEDAKTLFDTTKGDG